MKAKAKYPKILYLSKQYEDGGGPDGGGPWLAFRTESEALTTCELGSDFAAYQLVEVGQMKVSLEANKPAPRGGRTLDEFAPKKRKGKVKRGK